MIVDVRLIATDVGNAVQALARELGPLNLSIDTQPPSSSPDIEWELQVKGHREEAIARVLTFEAIVILALRERPW